MDYIRNCPTCKKQLKYKSKDSLRLSKSSNCRECGLKIRSLNNQKKDQLLMNEDGFIFRPKTDITGKTINCWQVLKFSGRRASNQTHFYYWDVQCLNCGIIVSKEISHINKTKSCRHCHLLPKGSSGAKSLFAIYKSNAKRGEKNFDLTLEQFKEITSSNCYYCNAVPSQIIGLAEISRWGDYVYNGIDRKDNLIGYTNDNCVPCCNICNWAKSNRTFEEFKKYIKGICENAINGTIPFLLIEN